MNRETPGETTSFQQTPSFNYLVYLFIVSAAFIVLLPSLFPIGGMLVRSGKKVDMVGRVKADIRKGSSATYTSLPPAAMMKRIYYSESKCEALEAVVVDLQKVVQAERVKTLELENEISVLEVSESILKERVQKLEENNSASRRASYAPLSPEFEMQKTPSFESKQENLDALVHELVKMVHLEKDRTSSLETEVSILQRSETILIDRMQKLEEKFALYMTTCRQSNVCDSENGLRHSVEI